jgi:hypothetical protein
MVPTHKKHLPGTGLGVGWKHAMDFNSNRAVMTCCTFLTQASCCLMDSEELMSFDEFPHALFTEKNYNI